MIKLMVVVGIAFMIGVVFGLCLPFIAQSQPPPIDTNCVNWNYMDRPLNPSYEDCITRDFCNASNPIIKQNCRCCRSKYGV